MEKPTYLDEIKEIRNIMERSTKFISLSGLSGILAGVYALIGAFLGHRITQTSDHIIYNDLRSGEYSADLYQLVSLAGLIALMAFFTAVFLSHTKAKKSGRSAWTKTSQRMLLNLFIPLAVGAVFILILFQKEYFGLIASSTLIFYGLGLLNAGNYTFSDVRYLGMLEVILGLIAGFLPSYGLYMWALGFGVLHIVYGIIMYYKYER